MMKILFIDLGNEVSSFFSILSAEYLKNTDFVFFSSKPKPISILKKNRANIYICREVSDFSDVSFEEIKNKISPKVFVEFYDEEKLINDAMFFYKNLRLAFEKEKPDAIFVWNGSGLASSLACSLAKDMGAVCLYGENGYFPGTMQLDNQGVNDYASINHNTKDLLKNFSPTPSDVQNFNNLVNRYKEDDGTLNKSIKNPLKPSFLSKIKDLKRRKVKIKNKLTNPNQLIINDIENWPKSYVFMPLQVHGDSQLIIHSPIYGQNIDALIEDTSNALSKINSDLKLIVKLHPKDNRCYDKLSQLFDNTIFIKDVPVKQLIRNSKAVVTINSTVGFEALLFNKPVVTAGSNFYINQGFTYDIGERFELEKQLRLALSTDEAPRGTFGFCHFIYQEYLTHGNPRNFSHESKLAVSDKIHSLLKKFKS